MTCIEKLMIRLLLLASILLLPHVAFAECRWSVDKDRIEVTVTGYKFSEKTGVSGKLPGIVIAGPAEGVTSTGLLQKTSFTIDARSINSGDATRDKNLRETFIATMKSPFITGKILKAAARSRLVAEVTMHGITKEVAFNYQININKKLTVTGRINVLDFALQPALSSLAKRCAALHTGPDGISKTWPTIDIVVTAQLRENCR